MIIASDPPLTFARYLRQSLGLAAIMFGALGGYLIVLKWRGPAAQIVTHTPWDEFFPFRPAWVWVYLLPYLIGPAVIGLLRPSTFRWFVQAGLTVVGITLLIFIVLPTQTATRPAHDLSGLTGHLYDMMISIDEPPANAAPSLHVSLTCLLALALFRDFSKWRPVTVIGVGLVWLATLLTRQHHLVDVGTGAVLALGVAYAWSVRREKPLPNMPGSEV